jgi:hypothetical protein
MLRRNLKHQLRYPSLTLMLAGFPIVFLLLFAYVFGGQLGTGLGGHGAGGRGAYLTYLVPGILITTVASAALGTAISVATDMTGGIIDRFRTMAISRGAVLTGHVIGSLLQTLAVLLNTCKSERRKFDWIRAVRLPSRVLADIAPKIVAGWRARVAVESPSHLRNDHPGEAAGR